MQPPGSKTCCNRLLEAAALKLVHWTRARLKLVQVLIIKQRKIGLSAHLAAGDFADIPSPSLLKHLQQGEEGAAVSAFQRT